MEANASAPWNRFDPIAYLAHNYCGIRPEDAAALRLVRDFFDSCFSARPSGPAARAIDVGTGVNLYPALSMLPFCRRLTLYEFADRNVEWLSDELAAGWPSWSSAWRWFWPLLRGRGAYGRLAEPRRALAERVEVVAGSVFDLDPREGRFDLGTMFFVAESISGEFDEFDAALHRFLSVLREGAPFALALMENSQGYRVGDVGFPAVAVECHHVVACLAPRVTELAVTRIRPAATPIRDGYAGLIVVRGRASPL